MQRHATFVIHLRACDFGTAQPACDAHLDSLRPKSHRVLDDPPHGPAVLHATFELLCHVLRDEIRIRFRLANFLHVHVHRYAHDLCQFVPQPFDILAFLADNDARSRGVNGHARGLRWPLYVDPADRSLRQTLAEVLANLQVVQQVFGIRFLLRIPDRTVLCDDAEPQSCWTNLLTHLVS